MTENKRFQVHKVIGSFHEWSIEDIIDDKVVFRSIIHKYSADILCAKLNELSEQADAVRTELQLCEEENTELQKENEQLKSFIKGTCIFCGANLRQQYMEKYGDIE